MFFESFFQDLRIGLRMLIKDKTFFLLAITVLALGICGVTTQFTMVNADVLRGFSFPHPEQLMSVGLIDPQATPQNNNFGNGNIPSSQDYEDLRAGQQSFALMSAYLNGSTINVTYNKTPQRYTGAYVTEDFFKIIDVKPILGRDFTAADNKPGAEKVTILGNEIWKRDFSGDPQIVGQAKRIAKDNPKTNGQLVSASVLPLLHAFTGPQLRQIIYAMLGAVIVVLLIACVNVMNMQFGRSALRARELAIRGALGATRWRIVRQMLTESFLIAFLGAVVGVAMAYWAVDLLA